MQAGNLSTITILMKKSTTLINLAALAVFALLMVWQGYDTSFLWKLLCFQLIIQWLSNEVWQRILSLPGILSLLLSTLGHVRPKILDRVEGIICRISAVTLVLVPNLFYVLIYVTESLFGNVLCNATGIEYTHSLFACSWCSMAVLWLMALWRPIEPLSITNLFHNPLDIQRITEKVYDARMARKPLQPRAIPIELPATVNIDLISEHKDLLCQHLADDETVLLTARPVATLANKYTRAPLIFTVTFSIVSILLLLFCVSIIQQLSGNQLALTLLVPAPLCLVFSACTLSLLRFPKKWKEKLSRIGYVVTNKRLFIMEKADLQVFSLNEKLYIHTENIQDDIGIIYISRPSMMNAMAGLVLGKLAQQEPDSAVGHIDLKSPLPGFFNCPNADKVFAMIESLRHH